MMQPIFASTAQAVDDEDLDELPCRHEEGVVRVRRDEDPRLR